MNTAGRFNASGISNFGGGQFNNNGKVAVGAASATPASATLGGLAGFNNAGTISMANGHANDSATISGNYNGTGAAQLDMDLIPGASISTDKLIVGGSATGVTAMSLMLPAGSQPLFNSGTVIVQAGAGSSAGAFGIAAESVNAGLVRYDVTYDALTARYSLVAAPSDAAYAMLSFGTAERNLWNKSADAVSAQMQSRRDALWSMGGAAPTAKFWMTMAGSVDRVDGSRNFGTLGQQHVTDTSYRQDYFGGQIGLGLSGGVNSRGGFSFGVTGGYNNSRVKLGGGTDSIGFHAINGGAYSSVTLGNIFINALGKYDYYWADADSLSGGYQAKLKGNAYGARGEFGFRFGGDSFFVEPVAQISYLRTALDRFNVAGTSVRFDDRDGLHGKAGARLGGVTSIGADTKMSFYAGGNYVHDFRGEGRVIFTNSGGSYAVSRDRMHDYGEAVAGINIASSRTVSGFMEANYSRSFKNGSSVNGKLEGVGGRAGINFKF